MGLGQLVPSLALRAVAATLGVDPVGKQSFRAAESVPGLSRLVDAVYGSASFVSAEAPGNFEVRVSTGGLLIRARPDSAAAP